MILNDDKLGWVIPELKKFNKVKFRGVINKIRKNFISFYEYEKYH